MNACARPYDFSDAVAMPVSRAAQPARAQQRISHRAIQTGIEGAARQKVLDQQPDRPLTTRSCTYLRDIRPIVAMGPDAIIMADQPGDDGARKVAETEIHHSLGTEPTPPTTGVGQVLAARWGDAHHPVASSAWTKSKNPPGNARTWSWRVFVYGALCIAGSAAACSRASSSRRDPNQGTCHQRLPLELRPKGPPWTNTGEAMARACSDFSSFADGGSGPSTPILPAAAAHATQPPTRSICWKKRNAWASSCPSWKIEHGTYISEHKDLDAPSSMCSAWSRSASIR